MSFSQAVSGYVRMELEQIYDLHCPTEIKSLVLAFYQMDLSNYDYIATFNAKQSEQSSYLCAFNLDSPAADHLHLTDTSNLTTVFQDMYGSSYKLGVFNDLPLSLRKALFPDYHAITKDILHIIFKIEGENRSNAKHRNSISAYLIETDSLTQLPVCDASKMVFDRCGLLTSAQFGVVAIGGYDYTKFRAFKTVQVLQSNSSGSLEWNDTVIANMNLPRSNMAHTVVENGRYIFVSGGWTSGTMGDTASVEMYDAVNKQWKVCAKMNSSRLCHGQLFDSARGCVYAIGGSRSTHSRSVERYEMAKDRWYEMPAMNYPRTWYPDVRMMEGGNVLMVNGDDYVYNGRSQHKALQNGWGAVEVLDLRDKLQKWVHYQARCMDDTFFGLNVSDCLQFHVRGMWSIQPQS